MTQSRLGVERRRTPSGAEHAPALGEERQTLVEREVLEEVLGVDRRDVRERQPLPDVEDLVDARQASGCRC